MPGGGRWRADRGSWDARTGRSARGLCSGSLPIACQFEEGGLLNAALAIRSQRKDFPMNKHVTYIVSGTLVVSMITVAVEEVAHGKAPSEVHLITSAPLTAFASASSTDV